MHKTEIGSICKDPNPCPNDYKKSQFGILLDQSFHCQFSLDGSSFDYDGFRNWNRWKALRQYRQAQQQNNLTREDADSEIAAEGTEEIPDGELCVICLTVRRRSAFVPCGHLVCCQRCALSVERDLAPKCPVCRQSIRTSVRIYDS